MGMGMDDGSSTGTTHTTTHTTTQTTSQEEQEATLEVSFYVNGMLIGQRITLSPDELPEVCGTEALRVGEDGFDGQLGEVEVYDRPLSDLEVSVVREWMEWVILTLLCAGVQ